MAPRDGKEEGSADGKGDRPSSGEQDPAPAPAPSPVETLARLRLIRTPQVGPATYHALLEAFVTAQAALEVLPELSKRGGRKTPLRPPAKGPVEDELAALQASGGHLLFHDTQVFPTLLRAIDPPPPLLFALGDLSLLERPGVGVVGARNASTNARQLARSFGEALSQAGFPVVSGMARGIDRAAHVGALKGGTVAVLAGGVDRPWPKDNEDLYGKLLEQGLVVSERPLGYAGRGKDFPRRNRIISGLSLGTLVVEAALGSGSLITATQAAEQGREVFAIPGNPLDDRARGTNKLIRDGAVLTETPEDVLEVLLPLRDNLTKGGGLDGTEPPHQPSLFCEGRPDPFQDPAQSSAEWSEAMTLLIGLIGPTPTEIDLLVRESGVSPVLVNQILLEWELAGKVERQPGHRVARLAKLV